MNENEAKFSISDSDKVVKAKPWEGDAVTDDEVIEIELPSSSGKRSSYEVPLTKVGGDSSSITGASLLKDVVKSKEKDIKLLDASENFSNERNSISANSISQQVRFIPLLRIFEMLVLICNISVIASMKRRRILGIR